ncbi:MAG TPA: ATP-binding protein, partial [Pyrinomonadaceae bacterium]|nr:ATP-binding protein [Pyrinomonadaceae bacterium]
MERSRQEEPEARRSGGEVSPPSSGGALSAQGDGQDVLFRIFAGTASDAILVIDADSRIHFANRAVEEIFGYPAEELTGQSLTVLMPEYLRHLHREGVERYNSTGVRHISWSGVELPGLHRDGRELALEISFGEFTRDGRRFFTGIARDISARRRDELRRAVQHAAARAFAEAASVGHLAEGILRAVCENLGWAVGAYWEVDAEGGELRCVVSWHQPDAAFTEFERCTSERTFAPGIGLPGRVWQSGEPAWITDVRRDDNFPRAAAAEREGVRAGFGFPVKSGPAVLGVMEFFSRETRPPDEELRALMASLGSQLGQFVVRRQVEDALRTAEEAQRFLAEAGELLASSLDYETTLQSIAQLVVPYLADWCTIDVLDADGSIERVAVAHHDPERVERVREIVRRLPVNPRGTEGVGKVIRTGLPEVIPAITDEVLAAVYPEPEKFELVRRLGLRSAMIVPMRAHGRTLGAISLAAAETDRRYRLADLRLAEDLARRAALAFDNARLFREAQEINHLKDEFLATLSHELRTPLTAILGWTSLLRTLKLDSETAASALATIERNAHSQRRLVDDMLDASRIITGKLRLDSRPARLAPVVEAAADSARPGAEAKRIGLTVETGGAEDLLIAGDLDRLQQVVWNLLSNAVKFTPEGGRVRVKLERAGADAVVTVSDTGAGIRPEFLPHVFDRFTQADSSTTRAYGGLGLGLSIARHLVELHGGTITAESEGEGRGATFRVRLPLTELRDADSGLRIEEQTQPAPATQAGPQSPGPVSANPQSEIPIPQSGQSAILAGLRVLVVDDDPDTLLMLSKTLERYGARTEACEKVAEALELLEREPFDVLVSDIGMPVEDGYALIRSVRAAEAERGGPRLPALALTAYARK